MKEVLHPSHMSRKVQTIVALNRTIVAFSVMALTTSLILFGIAKAYLNLLVSLPSLMIGFWLVLACVLAIIGVTKANYVLMLIGAIGASLAVIVCIIEATHLIAQYITSTDSIYYKVVTAALIIDALFSIALAALLIKRLTYSYSLR